MISESLTAEEITLRAETREIIVVQARSQRLTL